MIEIIKNDHYKMTISTVDDNTLLVTAYELMGSRWVKLGKAEMWDKTSFITEMVTDIF